MLGGLQLESYGYTRPPHTTKPGYIFLLQVVQVLDEGNNPENQNLAVWFCVRPGPTPFFAFGTPARFRVTGAASCGHYAAGAAGKKTVAHHH